LWEDGGDGLVMKCFVDELIEKDMGRLGLINLFQILNRMEIKNVYHRFIDLNE
jgi:hypothetical protein